MQVDTLVKLIHLMGPYNSAENAISTKKLAIAWENRKGISNVQLQVRGFEGGCSGLIHKNTPFDGDETFNIFIEPKLDDKT